jgi:hypothetical protein
MYIKEEEKKIIQKNENGGKLIPSTHMWMFVHAI